MDNGKSRKFKVLYMILIYDYMRDEGCGIGGKVRLPRVWEIQIRPVRSVQGVLLSAVALPSQVQALRTMRGNRQP